MTQIAIAVLAAAPLAGPLPAQDMRGRRIDPEIRVVSIDWAQGLVSATYRVVVGPKLTGRPADGGTQAGRSMVIRQRSGSRGSCGSNPETRRRT